MVVRDVHKAPGHEGGIAVLAVDVRVDILWADAEALCKRRLQAAGVEDGAGADDVALGNAGNFVEHIRQHVDRVRYDNIDGVRRGSCDLRGNVLDDVDVGLRQLQPALSGLAGKTRGNNDNVGAGGRVIVAGADDRRRTERRALIDIHGLAKGLLLIDVDQDDLRCGALDHQVVRNRGADASRADNSDLAHTQKPPISDLNRTKYTDIILSVIAIKLYRYYAGSTNAFLCKGIFFLICWFNSVPVGSIRQMPYVPAQTARIRPRSRSLHIAYDIPAR